MKYRKKPVIVEAFQMTKEQFDNKENWPLWLIEAWNKDWIEDGSLFVTIEDEKNNQINKLFIHTLEGNHMVSWGDYIIRGVKGELYPCKPDIFEATYELMEAENETV